MRSSPIFLAARRRTVDHRSVAADGGRLAGDRRRDHVDAEDSALGKKAADGEVGLEAGERVRGGGHVRRR